LYKKLIYLFLSLILLAFLFIAISILGIIKYTKDLPEYRQLRDYSPSVISRLYTGEGSLLAEFSLQKRIFVPVENIPEKVKEAFVSAEDKNFFKHKGVDLISIVKASIINIKNVYKGKRLVGASTITQQVAKNFLLSSEVSINRKIKEALLALRIERILSKNEILELYLNEIFLGQRSYGVAAAALNYFNKSMDELTLEEIAYLAGLPKGPNNYHPEKNKSAAIIRRNYVLNRMYEDNLITKEVALKTSMKPLVSKKFKENSKIYAPYFIEEVRRKVIDKYEESVLYKEGLHVITTIDPRLQKEAIKSLRNGLENYDKRHGWRGAIDNVKIVNLEKDYLNIKNKFINYPGLHEKKLALITEVKKNKIDFMLINSKKDFSISSKKIKSSKWINNGKRNYNLDNLHSLFKVNDIIVLKSSNKISDDYSLDQIPEVNGAIVVIDPRNGRVLALSGGYDFDNSEFNRATQAKRQPGSAFKPFVYLAALESGYMPNTKVLDAPLVIDQGPGLEEWKPKNYSGTFYGPSTLRVGLEKSRNVMTVRLANQIGMKKITEISERFNLGEFPPLLATSLGAVETTLIKLVAAYASFVNAGRYNEPELIEKIQDREGKVIFKRDVRICSKCKAEQKGNYIKPILPPEGIQVLDPNRAFQITWMLKGVTKRGTAKVLKNFKYEIAGKTGTTNDNMDAWFLGVSPELAVGVYVGYDNPKDLGDGETGGKVAVPIFAEFMKAALKEKEQRPFLVPEGVEMVKIDYKTGSISRSESKNTIYEAFIKGYSKSNKKNPKTIKSLKGLEGGLY
tara:strand:- start:310 stop:2694 length:2385 start_codon:yes stop_codon:yes gene_type:complete